MKEYGPWGRPFLSDQPPTYGTTSGKNSIPQDYLHAGLFDNHPGELSPLGAPQHTDAVASPDAAIPKDETSILVLDHDPAIAEICQYMLCSRGYDAWAGLHSSQAVDFAKALKPTVILVNLGGAMGAGIDTCRALRAQPELAESRIVIMTSTPSVESARMARAAGATRYVHKPGSSQQAAEIIENALVVVGESDAYWNRLYDTITRLEDVFLRWVAGQIGQR